MFEYKIQEAWENYKDDLGLGRMALFTIFFGLLLFFLSGFGFGEFRIAALLPVVLSFSFYLMRPQILKLKDKEHVIFVLNYIHLGVTIILNYILIGMLDTQSGGLPRLDPSFVKFDLWLYGMPVSVFWEQKLNVLGWFKPFFYDLLTFSYLSYMLIPLYGGILYYLKLPTVSKYKLGRYMGSLLIFFTMNYLCYLLIPVTGPQYFLKEELVSELPFTHFGQFFYNIVDGNHQNFIDCFPSGHTGISVLVTIWLFRIKHSHRYFMLFLTLMIIMATLSLRYHYTLDVICAIPMSILCYYFGRLLIPTQVLKLNVESFASELDDDDF